MKKLLVVLITFSLILSCFSTPIMAIEHKQMDKQVDKDEYTIEYIGNNIESISVIEKLQEEQQVKTINRLDTDSCDITIECELIEEFKVEQDEISIRSIPTPDIYIYNFQAKTSEPFTVGEDVAFKFTIANIGDEDVSGNIPIAVFLNDSNFGTLTIPALKEGYGATYSFSLYADDIIIQEGSHRVGVTADPDNLYYEKNESNNTDSDTFTWTGGTYNLKAISFEAEGNGTYYVDEEVAFNYVFSNDDVKNIEGFQIGIYLNNKLEATITSGSTLKPYTIYNLPTIRMNFKVDGTYNVEARLDPNDDYDETNENDNGASTNVVIEDISIDTVWFSQISSTAGEGYNNNKLNYTFFPNSTGTNANGTTIKYTPLEWNKYDLGEYYDPDGNPVIEGNYGIINDMGCVATTLAMQLENVNAESKSKHFDIRYGTERYLNADPFTMVISNARYPEATTTTDDDGNTRIDFLDYIDNPTYMITSTVANDFGYDTNRVQVSGWTSEQKAELITELLQDHPEGVMTRIGWHTFLIVDSSYTSTRSSLSKLPDFEVIVNSDKPYEEISSIASYHNIVKRAATGTGYEEHFTVCDPGTGRSEAGDHVNFTKSYSYTSYSLDFSDISYVETIVKQ